MSKEVKKINWNEVVRPESDYGKGTAWMREKASNKASYTKEQMIGFLKSIGKNDRAALETAVVLLSPREKSTIGDCRGNKSNPWGHLAYNQKIARRVINGRKEVQRFRFCLRIVELEPRKRNEVSAIASKKIATQATTQTPVKAEVKVKA